MLQRNRPIEEIMEDTGLSHAEILQIQSEVPSALIRLPRTGDAGNQGGPTDGRDMGARVKV
jgi:hypothetical protein